MRTTVDSTLMHRLVCEVHREFSPIPLCPWPGCSKGIAASEVNLRSPQNHVATYRRVEWPSRNDESKSYTWSLLNMPLTFGLRRVVWRECLREGLLDRAPTKPPIVYHYTDPAGFLGILESRSLWLSDYSYLNDPSEIRYGVSLAQDRLHRLGEGDHCGLLQEWAKSIAVDDTRVYLACFSREGESISHWREYGDIAVGFEYSTGMFGYTNTTTEHYVVYDRKRQEEIIDLVGNTVRASYDQDWPVRPPEGWEWLTTVLMSVLVLFKDPAYRDEREFRIAHVDHPSLRSAESVRFRAAAGRIIPYMTTRQISHAEQPVILPIADVWLSGRASEALQRGVREALAHHGYSGVSVEKSQIPIR